MDRTSIYDSPESSPNLYESKALGSRNEIPEIEGAASLRRFFRGRNAVLLSNFSNVCEKLQIPVPVRETAWTEFQKMSRKAHRRAAEHACFALYNACRIYGMPVSDAAIIEAVKMGFSRKKIPSMLSIIYGHMRDGSRIRRIDDRKYRFNLTMKDAPEMDIRKKRLAWQLFTDVYVEGSFERRAKAAISEVLAK